MSKEDICTHFGEDHERYLGAVIPPIFQTTLFSHRGSVPPDAYSYTRTANPTTDIAECKIAALEGGEKALCFSSGMAAITSAILHWLDAGSHVISIRNVYGPANRFLTSYLHKFGVETTFVAGEDVDEFATAIRPNTKLIYLESPSSLVFSMQDLAAIADLAQAHNIATVIDNSWATPLFQNPIALGIDMVVHSATKYLGGHSDIIAGAIVGKHEHMEEIARNERSLLGGVMDPHQSWLLIRGMRTLPVRLKQHQENAMQIAHFLEEHPKVIRVLYPGLPSHPQYELGRKQMTGYSGLLGFVPKGTDAEITSMVDELHYFLKGPSWGGFESLVSPAGVGLSAEESKQKNIPQGLVRIHVGLENVATLMGDLDRALSLLGNA